MNSNRIWVLGSVLVIFAILVATWFLGVAPQLALAGAADDERATVEAQNVSNQATLDTLRAQFEGIDGLRSELAEVREIVPADKDQAPLLKEIGAAASKYDVDVVGVTFEDAEPYLPGDSQDPEVQGALAVVNSNNFLVIPMAMSVAGNYEDVMNFIDTIQKGDRLVLVHSLGMSEGLAKSGERVQISISAETYVLLDAANTIIPVEEESTTTAPVEGTPQ